MQVLFLCGSKNPEGRTAQAINTIAKGVAKAGGNTESFFLPELAIERCRQCESNGWGICQREARCIIEDDFASVFDKLRAADVAVFATPVYFGDLSESTRGFLDRLRRICARNTDENLQEKPVVALALAGGRGGNAPNACVNLAGILQRSGFDLVDVIPLRRQNLDAKLPILELIGEWLATKPTSE